MKRRAQPHLEAESATDGEAFLKSLGIDAEGMDDSNLWRVGSFDQRFDYYMAKQKAREQYVARFGFAVLTQRIVAAVARYSPLLEIGCGSGYWTYELRKAGADCIATDPGTGRYGYAKEGWTPYVEIDAIRGVTAVTKYPSRALLIVWPDYGESWAAKALRAYEGPAVLYVGEGRGGCTADNAFHARLEKSYSLADEIHIPQFPGIHDRLEVYTRKAST